MKKILLYSGGMDSWLIRRLWKPDECLYIDMKTRYSERERSRLDSNIRVVDFPLGQWEREDAIIPLRNLYLSMVVCNTFPDDDLDICLGATAGDRVLDKSPDFSHKASDLLSYLWQTQHWTKGRKVNINIDFKNKTKTEMLAEYISRGGNIVDAWYGSFSCYNPVGDKNCGCCKPCFRKFVSFALNGMEFSRNEIEKTCEYIMREIYPAIQQGVYGRAREEEEIKQILAKYGYIKKQKTYLFDFDDTITEHSPFPVCGKVRKDICDKIIKLKEAGCRIIIHTARRGYFLKEAEEVCRQANIPYDEIIGEKPTADFYVDTTALRPEEL